MAPRRSSRRQGGNSSHRKSKNNPGESSEEEFVVEAVVDEKANGTVLVKWEGYNEPTWEPMDAIPASFIKRYRAHSKSHTK